MKKIIFAIFALLAAFSGIAFAAALVGQIAPEFTLTDLGGRPVNLADFKGKAVILEWHNPNCPFVARHYDSGNIPGLQSKYAAGDTVWLSINSTHHGHRDYMNTDRLKNYLAAKKASPHAYMIDADGKVGMEYAAKTTPQMFVINPTGMLVYAGAINDQRSTRLEDVMTARNYVVAAVEESTAGKPVSVPSTQPYGCSVKYR